MRSLCSEIGKIFTECLILNSKIVIQSLQTMHPTRRHIKHTHKNELEAHHTIGDDNEDDDHDDIDVDVAVDDDDDDDDKTIENSTTTTTAAREQKVCDWR